MSTTATVAAVAKAAQEAWQAFCKMVMFKRRQIARAELEARDGQGQDLDGDGVMGGVGNTPRTRELLRRAGQADRGTDAQRQILAEGRNPDGSNRINRSI